MKTSFVLLSVLFSTLAHANDAWVCSASCTRFTYIYHNGFQLQRYRGEMQMRGPSAGSAEDALVALKNFCRRRTPEDFEVSVDYEVRIAYVYGVPIIHKDTISATTRNSCFRL